MDPLVGNKRSCDIYRPRTLKEIKNVRKVPIPRVAVAFSIFSPQNNTTRAPPRVAPPFSPSSLQRNTVTGAPPKIVPSAKKAKNVSSPSISVNSPQSNTAKAPPPRVVPPFSASSLQRNTVTGAPPKTVPRVNKPTYVSSKFQDNYLKGNIPVTIDVKRNILVWTEDPESLEYEDFLPMFFEGLIEKEYPYNFYATEAIRGMIVYGPKKVVRLIPQLIPPLRKALSTINHGVVCQTLKVIQDLALSSPEAGKALIAYYKIILPHFNKLKNLNLERKGCHTIVEKRENVSDLVDETLQILDLCGGKEASVSIKKIVPSYNQSLRTHTKYK